MKRVVPISLGLVVILMVGTATVLASDHEPGEPSPGVGAPTFLASPGDYPPGITNRVEKKGELPPGLHKKLNSEWEPPGIAKKDSNWEPPGIAKKGSDWSPPGKSKGEFWRPPGLALKGTGWLPPGLAKGMIPKGWLTPSE